MSKAKHKLPTPQTKEAWLSSYGISPLRFTRHTYTRTLECITSDGDAYEFLFKCSETGTERRWGTEFIPEETYS